MRYIVQIYFGDTVSYSGTQNIMGMREQWPSCKVIYVDAWEAIVRPPPWCGHPTERHPLTVIQTDNDRFTRQ